MRDVNWLAPADAAFECAVKVRSTRPPVAARVTPLAGDAAEVELLGVEEAVAPGQACVFYETRHARAGRRLDRARRTGPAPLSLP